MYLGVGPLGLSSRGDPLVVLGSLTPRRVPSFTTENLLPSFVAQITRAQLPEHTILTNFRKEMLLVNIAEWGAA